MVERIVSCGSTASDNCFQKGGSFMPCSTLNTRLDNCYGSSLFNAVFIFDNGLVRAEGSVVERRSDQRLH